MLPCAAGDDAAASLAAPGARKGPLTTPHSGLLRATPLPPHREVTKAASLPASLIAGKGVARSVVTARPASVSE